MTLGSQKLRRWRHYRQQKEAAAELGISDSMYSLLERGLRVPSNGLAAHIYKIAHIPMTSWRKPPEASA